MPPDPEKNIEETLKAYAKQRREQAGAPFELHAATRRMLQEEVKRLAPKPAGESGRKSFFSTRRLIWTGIGAVAAAICAAVLVMEQTPLLPPSLLARKKEAAVWARMPSMPAAPPVTELQANPAAPIVLNELALRDAKEREKARQNAYFSYLGMDKERLLEGSSRPLDNGSTFAQAGELTLQGQSSTTGTFVFHGGTAGGGVASYGSSSDSLAASGGNSRSVVRSEPVTPAAPAPDFGPALTPAPPADAPEASSQPPEAAKPVPPDQVRASGPIIASTDGAAKKVASLDTDHSAAIAKTKLLTVLTTFAIRLDGDQIRLTDADGSVYVGKVVMPKAQRQSVVPASRSQVFSNTVLSPEKTDKGVIRSQLTETPSGIVAGVSNTAAPAAEWQKQQQQQSQQTFSFRASGTNLTLKQVVVIKGNYWTNVPQIAQAPVKDKQSQREANDVKQEAAAAESQPSYRIQGQAQIGSSEKLDIDAIAVDPEQSKTKAP